MKIFQDYKILPKFCGAAATIGSFDGVHKGHRHVLRALREAGGENVVITFSPHPRGVLRGEAMPLLTTLDEKAALLEAEGVDNLLVIPFTHEFAAQTAAEFADLLRGMGITKVIAGFNQRFGSDRSTDLPGIAMEVLEPLAGIEVSSSMIRALLAQGETERAAELLGRCHCEERSDVAISHQIRNEIATSLASLTPRNDNTH